MSKSSVKFNTKDRPEFHKELQKRVNQYFKENNISRHADWNMKIKTVFMFALYFVPFFLMLNGFLDSSNLVFLLWVLMGIGMSGIGLCIMHDANHGSYSSNRSVNKFLGFVLNFVGGYHTNWKIQHNVLHHTYTNIEGLDDDIGSPVLRFSEDQKSHPLFKFQAFFAPLLYGIMSLYWVLAKDFVQLIKYNKMGLFETQGKSFNKALFEILLFKTIYILFTIGLPLYLLEIGIGKLILGFFLMQLVSGIILALVFQPAHVNDHVEFHVIDENGSVENNWAIHQMKTTTNFGNGSKWFSWLVGGLNFQVEHHLFPNVCHVHYPKLAPIVKEVAKEYEVPYNHYRTFYGAIKGHFSWLDQMGSSSS